MKLDIRNLVEKTSEYTFLFLLAYMPVYVLVSTWIGTSTGTLDAIKISKEVILVFGFLLALGTTPFSVIKNFSRDRLVWFIAVYAALTIFMALIKPTDQDAEAIAVAYNLRFLLFFLYAGLLVTRLGSDFIKKSVKIVLGVGVIVALFGIFQVTLLPDDALSKIGYSRENGTPAAFYISDKTKAIERAYSTAKDPNSFGAYLIIIITFSALYLIQKWPKQRLLLGGITLVNGLALLLTYSRSAWIGAAFSITALILFIPRTRNLIVKYKNKILISVFMLIAIILSSLFVFRDSSFVQNTVFHVGDDAAVTSNSGRVFAIDYTIKQIGENPLGYGPGTAGPSSFKNEVQGPVIPENYYLQLGHEVGVLGLAMFLSVCVLVIKRLFDIRKNNYVAIALIASFVGIAIANLFVHIWFFEPVAYTWWGIAGLVVYLSRPEKTKSNQKLTRLGK